MFVDDATVFVLSDRDIMRVERTVLDNFYLVSNAACRLVADYLAGASKVDTPEHTYLNCRVPRPPPATHCPPGP